MQHNGPNPAARKFVTLRDAATTISTKLPKAEHDAPKWRTATEALTLVAEHGGSTMMARIGVMRSVPVSATELTSDPHKPGPSAHSVGREVGRIGRR